MRFVAAALTVLLVAETTGLGLGVVQAFVPSSPSVVSHSTTSATSTTSSTTSSTSTSLSATYKLGENDPNDVTVPYDAAARLAYEQWTKSYNKQYDPARYETFRTNYEALAVANVKAAKAAREAGGDAEPPKKLDLNEYADMTAEEYMAMQRTGGTTALQSSDDEEEDSTGDVLGKAVEAAGLQSDASSALAEAADALAEEEEVRYLSYTYTYIACTWSGWDGFAMDSIGLWKAGNFWGLS